MCACASVEKGERLDLGGERDQREGRDKRDEKREEEGPETEESKGR